MEVNLSVYQSNGAYGINVTVAPGIDTAGDLLRQITDAQLARWNVPREYAVLVPWAAQPWTQKSIIPSTTILRQQPNQLAVIDERTLPCTVVDAELLAYRLAHINKSARGELLQRLSTMAKEQLDLKSIREQKSALNASAASAQEMHKAISILCSIAACAQGGIHFEGEELFPYRLLPNDGGVEFRSGFTYEYRIVKEEDRLARGKLTEAIAHCQKLLADLPIALENSQTAMQQHSRAEEVDLNTLGAMVMEQKRIQEEIDQQAAQWRLIEEEAAALAKKIASSMQLFECQTQVTLPFGRTKVGDRLYCLQRGCPVDGPIMGEVRPTSVSRPPAPVEPAPIARSEQSCEEEP